VVLTYRDYSILMNVMNAYTETSKHLMETGEGLEDYNSSVVKPQPKPTTPKSTQIGSTPWYMDVELRGARLVLKSTSRSCPTCSNSTCLEWA